MFLKCGRAVHQLGSLINADSDSVGLGWGLSQRFQGAPARDSAIAWLKTVL